MNSRPESDSDDESGSEISYNMWSEEEDSDQYSASEYSLSSEQSNDSDALLPELVEVINEDDLPELMDVTDDEVKSYSDLNLVDPSLHGFPGQMRLVPPPIMEGYTVNESVPAEELKACTHLAGICVDTSEVYSNSHQESLQVIGVGINNQSTTHRLSLVKISSQTIECPI